MDLRVARVAEAGAALVGAPAGRDIGAPGVGRQVVDVAVAAGRQHHRVGAVPGDLARLQIADDDALGVAVDHHQVEHLGVGVRLDPARADHLVERRVGSEQELLAGLTPGVERAGDLSATERAVVEQPAILAGEGHTLGRALVDDVHRHLGQAMHVGLTGAVIAALDGVVEEAMHRITIVLVILGGIDATLCGHRVGATGGIMEHEVVHLVAQLGQGRRGAGTGQTGTDHDDLVLPLVGRVDQLGAELVFLPLVGQRTGGNLRIERGHISEESPWWWSAPS